MILSTCCTSNAAGFLHKPLEGKGWVCNQWCSHGHLQNLRRGQLWVVHHGRKTGETVEWQSGAIPPSLSESQRGLF